MSLKKVVTMILATFLTFGGSQLVAQAAVLGDTTFSKIEGYIEVRTDALETSEVVGKFYEGAKATIVGENEEWYKIHSGNVEGYVQKDLVITGEEATQYAQEVGTELATVQTEVLSVRQQPNLTSEIINSITIDTQVEVLSDLNGWLYIDMGASKGYISDEYVVRRTEFKTAETIEEEQARIALENETLQRQQLVEYALQFVGNPYVYGGTSLTNGTDCSGFTQSVYEKFGYSIPRSSREQDDIGNEVSTETMQPGDLIFYARGGRVNHVALYIGDGQIVHASSPKTGIKVSNYDYRQPVKVVSIM